MEDLTPHMQYKPRFWLHLLNILVRTIKGKEVPSAMKNVSVTSSEEYFRDALSVHAFQVCVCVCVCVRACVHACVRACV